MATTTVPRGAELRVPPRERADTPRELVHPSLHRIDPAVGLVLLVAVAWPLVIGGAWPFILSMSLLTGIVGMGTMVVVGWARETTLMQAGLTGTALYLAGWAYRDNTGGLGWPFPVAVAFAVAVVVAISIAVAMVASRLSPIYILVLTLTVQFTIENTLFTYGTLTGGLQAPTVERPRFFGASLASDVRFYYFLLAITLVLMYALHVFKTSRFGRAMIMVGNDRESAAAVGVNPWRYKIGAYALGGAFAGIGGALWAPQLGSPPGPGQFGTLMALVYLAVPVLAGFGSIIGVVAVGMAFMALPMAATQYGFSVQPLLLGGFGLLVGILAGPRGISGAVATFRRWVGQTVRHGSPRDLLAPTGRTASGLGRGARRLHPVHLRERLSDRASVRALRGSNEDDPWQR
ncbi:MAG: ABC transporter permease subunit [Sporichthyaceae bacterium]|jgi:ABC-type branched-subunit amino acid transport system permease subunit